MGQLGFEGFVILSTRAWCLIELCVREGGIRKGICEREIKQGGVCEREGSVVSTCLWS